MINRDDAMRYFHESSLSTSFYYSSCANKEASGPAARSLEFPMPTVVPCVRHGTVKAYDHRSGKVHVVHNVIVVLAPNACHGYLVREKLAKSTYGVVRQCVVLKRRSQRERMQSCADVEWESTDQLVAIKVRTSEHNLRRKHKIID